MDRILLDKVKKMKFETVSCSQCGQDFDFGYHGYSECSSHKSEILRRARIVLEMAENGEYPPIAWSKQLAESVLAKAENL